MQIPTQEPTVEEKKEQYLHQKEALLKTYQSYAQELAGAESNFEEELIVKKREKLAVEIKSLCAKLKEIEHVERVV